MGQDQKPMTPEPATAPSETSPGQHLLAELQRELGRLAREYDAAEATLDLMFLAYLLKTSRFGYFTYGPVTIDVRLIEDLVGRTVTRAAEPGGGSRATYSDDMLRFLRVLSDELERSGQHRIDEAHILLAMMQANEGIPGRVFAELGVDPETVRRFTPGAEPSIPGKLYSPEEAAEYLGVHVKTVRNWIRAGRLPARRLAGQRALRIRAVDLERILEPVNPDDLDRPAEPVEED